MKYWLKYKKLGLLRFVGHLDTMHSWERILRRANIPMAFSQGFSPHPLMSLAMPLSVGQISSAEYLEIELIEEWSVEQLLQALDSEMPQEMQLFAGATVPAGTKPLMGLIRYADYLVEPLSGEGNGKIEQEIAQFLLAEQVLVELMRKRGPKVIDVRPLVREVNHAKGKLFMRLATGSEANLRAEDFLKVLGISMSEDPRPQISREELYIERDGQLLTPLEFCSRG